MKYSDLSILIVDDDASIQESLSKALESAGFKVIVAGKPAEALSIPKVQQIHGVIMDCMLPGKNGVELAIDIRRFMADTDFIFFITGIYKDKRFAKEAIRKVNAERFFYKPFDVMELISAIKNKVNQSLDEEEPSPTTTLPSILSKITPSIGEVGQSLESQDQSNGFHLSFYLPTLMLLGATGHLHIMSIANQRKSSIELVKGKIREIYSENALKIIGELLIKQGLLNPDEYREITNKTKKENFTSALVDDHWISPHAMVELKKEQIFLELEEIMGTNHVQISFTPKQDNIPSPCDIDYKTLQSSLFEIIEFQISDEWLKDFYAPHINSSVVMKIEVNRNHPIFKYPVTRKIENLFDLLAKSPTLKEILSDEIKIPKSILYQSLHALTINQSIIFVDKTKQKKEAKTSEVTVISENKILSRLNILLDGIKDKSPPEIFCYLGSSEEVTKKEAQEIFKTFSESNHPNQLPPNASNKIKSLNQKIFSYVSDAYEIITNDEKRKKYNSKIESKELELQSKAKVLIEKGVINLRRGHFEEAIEEIKAAHQCHESHQTLLYLFWARLKMYQDKIKPEMITEINNGIMGLPSHYRKSEIYHLVYGLLKKAENNFLEAGNSMKKALQINPSFFDARKELMDIIKEDKRKNQNLFTGDFSTVVSGFFKKKGS